MPSWNEDWYLREWMAHFGKRQAALINELGWNKGRASKTWNGLIPYRKETVLEVARWLGIRPYELLMSPNEALALRRLRETARAIVAEEPSVPFVHDITPRTGTGG
jgi:hypothetical protein